MYIKSITVNCFRNIHEQLLQLAPSFNVFYGENGSGKTSLLEAIYYLGRGKSFRTSLASRIIEYNQPSLMLTASLSNDTNEQFIGVERTRSGERTIKLNREIQTSIAPLARTLPLQLLSVDSYRYFSDGPKERRSFLDWGVFHMNSGFLELWQRYNRVLKQRNMALKSRLARPEVTMWDSEYILLSEQIDELRNRYLDAFKEIYHKMMVQLLPNFEITEIRYKRGWPEESLVTLLNNHFSRDMAFGYTQEGPHRCDLQLYINKCPADDVLSQGQQKLAAYGLFLAQGVLLKQQTGKAPIYLIDDLPSELDYKKQTLILDIVKGLGSQVFITSITAESLNDLLKNPETSVFHVEHGQITTENRPLNTKNKHLHPV